MKNNSIGELKSVMFFNENKKNCYITTYVGDIIALNSNGFSNLFKGNTFIKSKICFSSLHVFSDI